MHIIFCACDVSEFEASLMSMMKTQRGLLAQIFGREILDDPYMSPMEGGGADTGPAEAPSPSERQG